MDTLTLTTIHEEIERVVEARRRLWHDLSLGHDAEKSAEVERLTARIEELWRDARIARTRQRFGPPDAILKRARADERLEREYAKVA